MMCVHPAWIRLSVLNQRFEVESEIDVLRSEICLLQEYSAKADELIPALDNVSATVIRGWPRFCAVSVKSGLQFRVSETIEEIEEQLWTR
jgi:hypothetical protein